MVQSFDFMVIGGGTGGLRTALYAAGHGHKTVLFEPGALGGTCLNVGCIPTKALLQSVHVYQNAKNAKEFGIKTSGVSVDFKALMKRVHGIIEDGQDHIEESVKNAQNLTIVKQKAQFIDGNTVQAGTETYTAQKIVIATGARSATVPIPGLEGVKAMTSDDVLNLTELPKSLLMIGGGYIAMELATFFNGLGCKTTILERMPRILMMLDEDVTNLLTECYTEEGISVNTNINLISLKMDRGKVVAETNDVRDPNSKKTLFKADKVLVSVGRTPNTDGLALEKAGINLDQRKNIIVNEFYQTTNPAVYALGDANGKSPFAHGAKRQSKAILDNALTNAKSTINTDVMPFAVFTDPPVAGVGMSEKQARDKGIDVGIMKGEFKRAGRATIIGDTRGFVKVIYNKKDNTMVGVVIVGPEADNLIHEFVAVMNTKTPTIDIITQTIHIHPTLAEVMDALKIVS